MSSVVSLTGSGETERRFFDWGPDGESRDRRGDMVSKKRLLNVLTAGAAEWTTGEEDRYALLVSARNEVSTSMASSMGEAGIFIG